MKKVTVLTFTVVLSLFFVNSLFAVDPSIYNEYQIGTFKYHTLGIYGQDFLNWYKMGDDKHTYINIGAMYDYYNQSPDMTLYAYEGLSFDSRKDGEADAVSYTMNMTMVGAEKYFGGYNGGHVFGDLLFDYYNYSEADDPMHDLWLRIGAGYGRITNAMPLAQAIAIAQEMCGSADRDVVLKIADIIERWPEYATIYVDDAEIMFYNDIAAACGKPEGAMKARQVYRSPVYNISPRYVGWYLRAFYKNRFMISPELDEDPKGMFAVRGEYAKPIGLQGQVIAWAEYDHSLEEDADADMEFGFRGTYDHDYTWASWASFVYHMYGEMNINPALYTQIWDWNPALMYGYSDGSLMMFEVGTSKNIINKLTSQAIFRYSKFSEADDAAMEFLIRFFYTVF